MHVTPVLTYGLHEPITITTLAVNGKLDPYERRVGTAEPTVRNYGYSICRNRTPLNRQLIDLAAQSFPIIYIEVGSNLKLWSTDAGTLKNLQHFETYADLQWESHWLQRLGVD